MNHFQVVIEDTLAGNFVADFKVKSCDDLHYEVTLFDGSRHLDFEEQAAELENQPVGTSIVQEYHVYNSFRKFGGAMEEEFNFKVTISKMKPKS